MAHKPIEISSESDSWDLEADESFVDDSVTSSDRRRLPSWANSAGPSSAANGGPSHKNAYRASTSNKNILTPGRLNHVGTDSADHSRMFVKAPSRTSTPNGSSSLDYGQHLYGQVLKRRLPPSLKPHVRGSNDLVGNLGSSQMRETYARSYPAQGIPNHVKNQSGRECDDEVLMYDKNGTLISPKPIMPRISPSTAQHATSADPSFHSGAAEYDERFIYQAALQDLNQPKAEADFPDGLLSVSLLKHQKIALAWMLQKENSYCCSGGFLADDQGLGKTISMIALIQYQKRMHSKFKSEDVRHQKAEALNLDDDDENDANALEKVKQDEGSLDLILIPEASTSTRNINIQPKRPQAGTLVVCPASVLRQWARELEEKVAYEARLQVLIYHGSSRTKDPVELAKYDVVVTTYAIVANEVPQTSGDDEDQNKKNMESCGLISDFSGNNKRKQKSHASKKRKKVKKGIDSSCIDNDCGTLAKVRWLRVILDEAQTIKNHRTQVARACAGFKAKSRWCLSGTPIQNTIDDLFSYFRFLKYDPYTTYRSFCTTLKNPISRDSVQGYKKLYAVLRAVMLRRTKGTFIDGEPIIRLPRKTINLIQSEFSKDERDFYTELETNSLSQFKAYAAAGTLNQNYANILLMLLRLRQACDHPLLTGSSSDSIGRDSMQMGKNLPKNMLINLMKHLDTSAAICCVCNDPPEDAIVTMCGHVFCYQCVSEYLRGDENTCPSHECKELLGPDVIFSKATLRNCLYGNDHVDIRPPSEANKSLVLQNGYISSKIKVAMEILQSHCKSNNACSQLHGIVGHSDISSSRGKEKSDSVGSIVKVTDATAWSDAHVEAPKKAIVFSQWTGMLDLVEISLNQSALKYRRLDGTMTLSARDKAVKEFNNNPEVTVMLMSLKAGNLGLNMVAATQVVLLDLWWNPTTEDQAIDRAHRIGQTQPVTVSRLTVKNTVEERILALQEEKRKMVASAFGEDQSGGSGTRLTVEDLRFLFMGKQ